ncbi:MAG: hypothetical protein AB7O97_12085 [Planctomycetota bacterium]
MPWERRGLLFAPPGDRDWRRTHASNPTAVVRSPRCVRVYYSSRDAARRSSIGWFEFDPTAEPARVTAVADAPVLTPGAQGLFDDSGASVGCVVADGDRWLLYYTGWNLGVTVPWRNSIGLAVSTDAGATFRRHGRAPILDRTDDDPFSLSYPWVARDGDGWRMWYGSNLTWGAGTDDMTHVLKAAVSDDGVHWRRDGGTALELGPGERCHARPCALRTADGWRMWFAARGAAYRIAAAESADGARWQRRDDLLGLAPSSSGWDAAMTCYPCVFESSGRLHLLYNGDGFGATGIGLAVWRDRP